MSLPTPTYLQDANGTIWLLSVTNTGQLQTTVVPTGTNVFLSLPLNDITNVSTSWLLSIEPTGMLQLTSTTFVTTYLSQLLINAPNGTTWTLQVNSGTLQTLPFTPNASTSVLTQVDTWELDNSTSNPLDTGTPIAWNENLLDQQRFSLAPTPANNGTIGFLYIQLATTLTGLGVNFAVPDDWTPYIMWGALAELLGSDGSAYDPVRANYCVQRYNEGVELARLVLGGSQ